VKELNKKVLGIAVALLLAAMFVAPVFAKRKVAVTATQMGGGSSGGEGWLVDDGIFQFRGAEGAGVVTLYIPGQDPLSGTSSSEINGKITFTHEVPPPDLDALGIMHLKMVWTFEGKGTFEGQMQRKGIGVPVITYMEAHMVLQGTGDFEGQTLILSHAGPPPLQWEGFLITS
jgi:hypothetical protein